MTISFDIPHDIERQLRSAGGELGGKAREAFLVELYREHAISHRQLGETLGLERYETDGLLKRYGVGLDISVAEIKDQAGILCEASP